MNTMYYSVEPYWEICPKTIGKKRSHTYFVSHKSETYVKEECEKCGRVSRGKLSK